MSQQAQTLYGYQILRYAQKYGGARARQYYASFIDPRERYEVSPEQVRGEARQVRGYLTGQEMIEIAKVGTGTEFQTAFAETVDPTKLYAVTKTEFVEWLHMERPVPWEYYKYGYGAYKWWEKQPAETWMPFEHYKIGYGLKKWEEERAKLAPPEEYWTYYKFGYGQKRWQEKRIEFMLASIKYPVTPFKFTQITGMETGLSARALVTGFEKTWEPSGKVGFQIAYKEPQPPATKAGPELINLARRPRVKPFTYPLTEAEFERAFGVDISLPEGVLITKVAYTKEGYALEYTPKPPPTVSDLLKTIPREATIIELKATPEGYQVQYVEGTFQQLEPPLAAPPKDVGQWLGKGWKGLVERVGEGLEPKITLPHQMGVPTKTRTATLIADIESTQQWLHEYPSAKMPMELKGWQYLPATERLAQALEFTYIPVGFVRSVEATIGKEVSLLGAGVSTALSPLPETQIGPIAFGRGAFTTEPLTQYWQKTKEHPFLIIGEVAGEYAQAKYVWGPLVTKTWGRIRRIVKPIAKRMPTFVQKYYYGSEWIARKTEKQLLWEKKPFAGYKEFYLQIETRLPTRPPPKKWYTVFKGKTTTPMIKTLERAITKGEPLGGLAARQQLIVTEFGKRAVAPYLLREILKVTPKVAVSARSVVAGFGVSAFLRLKPTAKVREIRTGKIRMIQVTKPTALIFETEMIRLGKLEVLRPKRKAKERKILIPKLMPFITPRFAQPQLSKTIQLMKQTQTIRQIQIQTQKRLQRQFQQLKMETPTQQRTTQILALPRRERIMPKRKRKGKGLFEEWFFQKHPLATPKEVLKQFTGRSKRTRRRRRRR